MKSKKNGLTLNKEVVRVLQDHGMRKMEGGVRWPWLPLPGVLSFLLCTEGCRDRVKDIDLQDPGAFA